MRILSVHRKLSVREVSVPRGSTVPKIPGNSGWIYGRFA